MVGARAIFGETTIAAGNPNTSISSGVPIVFDRARPAHPPVDARRPIHRLNGNLGIPILHGAQTKGRNRCPRSANTYRKSAEAIAALTPEQYRVTQQSGTERPGTGEYLRQQGAGHLRGHRLGRAAVRFVGQVRIGLRLAELHQADRACQRQRTARRHARHDPHRSAFDASATAIWATSFPMARGSRRLALLHQFGLAAVHPSRRHGSGGLRRLTSNQVEDVTMTTGTCSSRRRLLLGHAGSDPPLRRRDLDPRRLYRRRRAERDLSQSRHPCRSDRDHLRSREDSAIASCWSSSSRSTTRPRATARATTSARAIARRSTTTSDEQKRVAEDTIADVDASGLWPGKVVTEVAPVGDFWEAEPEHQDYLERIPNGYTCHFVRPDWKLPVRKSDAAE